MLLSGSSPLARGPPRGGVARRQRLGLIPARAGTTIPSPKASVEIGAHPRSRGDHCDIPHSLVKVRGSSPLARGPLCKAYQAAPSSGLIPARAGTTQAADGDITSAGAHPRSRGDHCPLSSCRLGDRGSSPLARGPQSVTKKIWPRGGLIPARAGTTSRMARRSLPSGAHPRSRGDHLVVPPHLIGR